MSLEIKKLDKRYDGHDRFSHRISFVGYDEKTARTFVECRMFMWKAVGPSAELNHARPEYCGLQPKWAWRDFDGLYIYVKDEGFTTFMLAKERFEV